MRYQDDIAYGLPGLIISDAEAASLKDATEMLASGATQALGLDADGVPQFVVEIDPPPDPPPNG